jgi:hypothetical protein
MAPVGLVLSVLENLAFIEELSQKIVCFGRPHDGWVFQEKHRPCSLNLVVTWAS